MQAVYLLALLFLVTYMEGDFLFDATLRNFLARMSLYIEFHETLLTDEYR